MLGSCQVRVQVSAKRDVSDFCHGSRTEHVGDVACGKAVQTWPNKLRFAKVLVQKKQRKMFKRSHGSYEHMQHLLIAKGYTAGLPGVYSGERYRFSRMPTVQIWLVQETAVTMATLAGSVVRSTSQTNLGYARLGLQPLNANHIMAITGLAV